MGRGIKSEVVSADKKYKGRKGLQSSGGSGGVLRIVGWVRDSV